MPIQTQTPYVPQVPTINAVLQKTSTTYMDAANIEAAAGSPVLYMFPGFEHLKK